MIFVWWFAQAWIIDQDMKQSMLIIDGVTIWNIVSTRHIYEIKNNEIDGVIWLRDTEIEFSRTSFTNIWAISFSWSIEQNHEYSTYIWDLIKIDVSNSDMYTRIVSMKNKSKSLKSVFSTFNSSAFIDIDRWGFNMIWQLLILPRREDAFTFSV